MRWEEELWEEEGEGTTAATAPAFLLTSHHPPSLYRRPTPIAPAPAADKLLQKKARKELLQPYDVRAAAAVEYMRAVNPGVVVTAGTLRDPAEPPAATTDPDYDGIVVSEETVPGALKINADRAALGFKPLTVVVIGIVLTPGASGGKLSSTDLRMSE